MTLPDANALHAPPRLARGLSSHDMYQRACGDSYSLLPLRYIALDHDRCVVTNLAGEYIVLPKDTVHRLIRHELPMHAEIYEDLKARHLLMDGDSTAAVDLLATKYRTKMAFLPNGPSLFMLVTTLRCDHSCQYCQVTRRSENAEGCDMSEAVAEKTVDFLFRSPSPVLKVEFQGGESLLHFERVKDIIQRVEDRNRSAHRTIDFVITTNLSPLTDDMLAFCREHGVYLSTSLDGPRELHNRNRPHPGHDSYEEVVRGIRRIQESLGPRMVSALLTTTRTSLSCPRAIIDEYIRQGFLSVFLRSINPYGFAVKNGLDCEYTMEEWLRFYRDALAYIIDLNYQGVPFREEFASLLLRKMLTPYCTGFVDLQSPAGIGISGIVVNYDGDVYASDESRMLAEMGDKTFRLGSVMTDAYEDILLSDALLHPLKTTMAEGVPGCADCGLQPYCGSDPVRHYRSQGDMVGFKPTSEFCRKHMGVMRHLIALLEDDPRAAAVLRTWVS